MGGWIGVDLDGTLAKYGGWKGKTYVGEPLMPMVERIRGWLAKGQEVRIFTARVAKSQTAPEMIEEEIKFIQDWLESECNLPRLQVTAEKDYAMIELWDDRCVQVEFNTGKPMYEPAKENKR